MKLQIYRPLAQVFSCEFCKIRKNTFFEEKNQTTASDYSISIVLEMKRELASETVNYDTKTMYQFGPQV